MCTFTLSSLKFPIVACYFPPHLMEEIIQSREGIRSLAQEFIGRKWSRRDLNPKILTPESGLLTTSVDPPPKSHRGH